MVEAKYEVILKNEVYDEIYTLMQNIQVLNNGKEIAGFLTGDWTSNKKTGVIKLLLDQFILPIQEVSSAEVEIDESGMMDVLKQIGIENGNRICAHWHIHPFSVDHTSWSIVDEEKIKDFMDPNKARKIFVFLLSSQSKIIARVMINWVAIHPITKEKYIISKSVDKIEVTREETTNNIYMETLKKKIKEKVFVKSAISYTTGYGKGTYDVSKPGTVNIGGSSGKENTSNYLRNYNKEDQFNVDCNKKKCDVVIDVSPEFFDYLMDSDLTNGELKNPDKQEILRSGRIRMIFKTADKKRMKKVMEIINNNLYEVQDSFYLSDLQNKNTQYDHPVYRDIREEMYDLE